MPSPHPQQAPPPPHSPTHKYCLKQMDLTNYIQQVSVFKAPMFVLHHTGVVPPIRGNHWLHYQSPHVVSDLKDWGQINQNLTSHFEIISSCPFAMKPTPWSLLFVGLSWTLSHSCTSADWEQGFQLLHSETWPSCWQERHGAASPSSPASPTAAPTLTRRHRHVNIIITITGVCTN